MTGDKQRIGQIPSIKTVSPNSTTIIPTLWVHNGPLIPWHLVYPGLVRNLSIPC